MDQKVKDALLKLKAKIEAEPIFPSPMPWKNKLQSLRIGLRKSNIAGALAERTFTLKQIDKAIEENEDLC